MISIREKLLLWQLADSQLPTGGFIYSNGLEALVQTPCIYDPQLDSNPIHDLGSEQFDKWNLNRFIRQSLVICAQQQLHFLTHAHRLTHEFMMATQPNANPKNEDNSLLIEQFMNSFTEMELILDAQLMNSHLTRKASRQQGISFLQVIIKGDLCTSSHHVHNDPKNTRNLMEGVLTELKHRIRRQQTPGHLCTVLGSIGCLLNLSSGMFHAFIH